MRILMIIDGLPGGELKNSSYTFQRINGNGASFSLCGKCVITPSRKALIIRWFRIPAKPWRKLTEIPRRARLLDQAIERAERSGKFDVVFSHLHKTDRIVAHCRALEREKSGSACMACSLSPIFAIAAGFRAGLSILKFVIHTKTETLSPSQAPC